MYETAEGGTSMSELKNCENCKHRKTRRSRGYPCRRCELLNPISFNSKWEKEPLPAPPTVSN